MQERIQFFVGLDVHQDSISVAACDTSREPARFVATLGPDVNKRRLLTEAAWNYRFPARLSTTLRERSAALPEAVRHHAWKAQLRLCSRFGRLSARGVQPNKVCVAVARELAGVVWAIAHKAAPPGDGSSPLNTDQQAACGDAVRTTLGRTLHWTINRRPSGNLRF